MLNIKSHILRDVRLHGWHDRIAGRWHYRDLVADAAWRDGWISFDTVTYNPDDGQIYCGLNAIDGDLLYVSIGEASGSSAWARSAGPIVTT